MALGVETLKTKLSNCRDLLCPKCLIACELTQQHSFARYWIRSGVAVSLTDAKGSLKDRWIGDSHDLWVFVGVEIVRAVPDKQQTQIQYLKTLPTRQD